MAPRVTVINHVRNLGKFRAVGGMRAHDHVGHDDCGCGGSCCADKGQLGLRDRFQKAPVRDIRYKKGEYEYTDLALDVVYAKGPWNQQVTETKHYVVPDVLVDPRGYGVQPAAVATALRGLARHIDMIKAGWTVKKAEGYYKQ